MSGTTDLSLIRAVVFDFDGTLIDTLPLLFDAMNAEFVPRIGRVLSPVEIMSHFGPTEQGVLASILHDFPDSHEAAFAGMKRYVEQADEPAQLYPGIVDLLTELRDAGIQLGIFTGKSRIMLDVFLRPLGLQPFFGAMIAGEDVSRSKPDAEGLVKVLNLLGVSPVEALMVGDSTSDIRAARDAGTLVCAAAWDRHAEPDVLAAAGPDLLCRTVAELRDALFTARR